MALSPEDLRKRIPEWSLESDGQLLQYMVQISKNLEQKCTQTQENLNRMLLQLDESNIRFANASNNFNGLQQSKFVENRVKDDDESFYSVREEPEESGEKLPHGEIFQMAVERSIGNMYKCFEKVTVELDSDSDSEDDAEEATARNTVLRAVQKYPYIGRPLPHIIGSQEWREKWHAGLIDSEEESETETKEQYSDSSDSEGMFPSQANSNHTPSESEGSVWGVHSDPRRRAPSMDPSVSGDDTMSIHSAASSAVRMPPSSARRTLIPQHKVQVFPPQVATQSLKPPSLFPDQPPPDDTYSVSSRSKVTNLFEESDEEESIPTHQQVAPQATKPQQPSYFKGTQQQHQERKTVNLFQDEPPPPDPELTPSTSYQSRQPQKKPLNLFIDSDDDEDDTFNNNNPSSSKSSSSVYQSEPPELPTPAKKTPVNLFNDDDNAVNNNTRTAKEEDDLFVPAKRSVNGAAGSGVRRVTNLFDDEPPVDDFDEIFKPKATDRKIPGAKLVLPPAPPAVKKPAEPVAAVVKKEVELPKVVSKPVETPPAKKVVNLFDDDDEDDDEMGGIFASSKASKTESVSPVKTNVTVTKPKVNLFDDDGSDDESSKIEEIKPAKSEPQKPNVAVVAQQSIRSEILKKKSIFDSDSNEEEDEEDFLFGSKKPATSASVEKKEPEPLPRKVEASNNLAHTKDEPPKEESALPSKQKEKPKIPDKPPEEDDDVWTEEPPADEEDDRTYPHVSNDIDYYLTTNTVTVADDSSEKPNETFKAKSSTEIAGGEEVIHVSNKKPLETVSAAEDNLKHDEPQSNTSKDELKPNTDPEIQAFTAPVVHEDAKSALSFNSIGLFDDVPPPDDNDGDDVYESRSAQPPPIDNSNDDFFSGRNAANDSNASANNSSSTNRYLFLDDDGPPPDDAVEENRDEVDDLRPSITAIIEERNKNESTYEDTREKPKVNRLSAKVNINVSALLPGARRPSEPKPSTSSSTVQPVNDVVASVQQESSNSQPEPESSTGKLTQLNKGRARIQAKRKPPSRQNRRANYENSLSQEDVQEDTKEIRVVVGSEVKPQHVEVTAAHLQINQLLSGELVEKLAQAKPLPQEKDEEAPKKPIIATVEPVIMSAPESLNAKVKASSKLFSDDESDDDFLFGNVSKTIAKPPTAVPSNPPIATAPPASTKPVSKQSIFDDSEDDDLFSKTKPTTKAISTPVASSSSNKPISKVATLKTKSIFGSDGESSDGDDIFSGTSKKSSVAPSTGLLKKKPQSQSLFGDDGDDDDEDDLFGSKSKITPKPVSTTQPTGAKKLEKPNVSTNAASDDPLADLLRS